MKKKMLVALLVLLEVLLILLNINIGSIKISPSEIMGFIFNTGGDVTNRVIVLNIRLPRTLAAMILGGALALSGYMLQMFFHNPIAGPFVLGISSGAKLAVAILMVISLELNFYANSFEMILVSFAGACLVTGFVLLVSEKIKGMSGLIVCGVMAGYICQAVTELIVSFADDSNIVNLHNWSMGSFSSITWNNVMVFTPVILICYILSFLMIKDMEAYKFGQDYAKSLGVNVKAFRIALIIVSSILSATVAAFAGPISFVGIAVPHMLRVIFGTENPHLIVPLSFVGGGIFCLISDLLARNLFAPNELSISTVTAIFGAPIVISLLIKRKKDY